MSAALREVKDKHERAEAELIGTVGAWVMWRHVREHPDKAAHVERISLQLEQRFAAHQKTTEEFLEALSLECKVDLTAMDSKIAALGRGET